MAAQEDWYDVLIGTDISTAQLIVDLHLLDIQDLSDEKAFTTPRTYDRVATDLHHHELATCRARLPDRKIAEDLEDHENNFEEALETAAFGWTYKEDNDEVIEAPAEVRYVSYIACADDFPEYEIVKVPCNHVYCHDCLAQLYESSMTDETLYPRRCCHQEFPWALVRHALSQQLRSRCGAKRVELDTKNRTYCHQNACSAFINPNKIHGTIAPCPRCRSDTCSTCKNAWHRGACPRDELMDELMQTANRNEWQRCYGCCPVIELKTGCNHITCVCKSEFCYVCGAVWKTCECDQWDEDRLLERAEAVVNRQPANARRQDRGELIQQAAEQLRENHECEHERFRGIGGRDMESECEMCGGTFAEWILRCRQCQMLCGNRCRLNRL